MGWNYIPLIELDLTGREDSRPAYAIEQQLQLKTFLQKLGQQRLNRVPGVGPWRKKPKGTVMVGFAYAPRGWYEKYKAQLAVVGGTRKFTPPEAGSSRDGSVENLTGIGANI